MILFPTCSPSYVRYRFCFGGNESVFTISVWLLSSAAVSVGAITITAVDRAVTPSDTPGMRHQALHILAVTKRRCRCSHLVAVCTGGGAAQEGAGAASEG